MGPFHKSFTSIIGPNGSGKSNVIDSMLFVFGYRAQKIRSKSVAVLIHKSEDHPDVHSCSVAVHFQLIVDKGVRLSLHSLLPTEPSFDLVGLSFTSSLKLEPLLPFF